MNNNALKHGFSLVELLVSIAIVAIITLVALPYFNGILARMETKKVFTTLESILTDSKYRAYIYHQRIAICGSKDGETCNQNEWSDGLLVFHDSTRNRLKDQHENIIHHVTLNLKYGILKWNGAGNRNIVFQSDTGLPRGSNGSFYYCSQFPENHRQMTLSQMGHANIKKITTC